MTMLTKTNASIAYGNFIEAGILRMPTSLRNLLQVAVSSFNNSSISRPLFHGMSEAEHALVIKQVTGSPV